LQVAFRLHEVSPIITQLVACEIDLFDFWLWRHFRELKNLALVSIEQGKDQAFNGFRRTIVMTAIRQKIVAGEGWVFIEWSDGFASLSPDLSPDSTTTNAQPACGESGRTRQL